MAHGYYLEFDSNAAAFARATRASLGAIGDKLDDVKTKSSGLKFKNVASAAVKKGVGELISAFQTLAPLAASVATSFVTSNAELQKLEIRMETAAGGVAEGARAMEDVLDMSITTPFGVEAIADSFSKLLASDMPEVESKMRSLTDAIAAFGGGPENLRYATIAIFQMFSKQKIFMEELRRQFAEQVPTAFKALADGLGLSITQLFDEIESGNIDALEGIDAMFSELDKKHGGAAARLMGTWDGQIIRIQTLWKLFMRDVGQAEGSFDSMTAALRAIGDAIQNVRTNPAMQETINGIATSIATFFDKFQDPRSFELIIENFSNSINTILDTLQGASNALIYLIKQFDRASGQTSFKPLRKLGIDEDLLDSGNYIGVRDELIRIKELYEEIGDIPRGQMTGSFEELSERYGEETAENIRELMALNYELREELGQYIPVGAVGTVQYEEAMKVIGDRLEKAKQKEIAVQQKAYAQLEDMKEKHVGTMVEASQKEVEASFREQDFGFIEHLEGKSYDSEIDKIQAIVEEWSRVKEARKEAGYDFTYPEEELDKWQKKLEELGGTLQSLKPASVEPEEISAAISDETLDKLASKVSGKLLEAPISPKIDDVIWDEALAGLETKVSEFGPIEAAIDITTSLSLNTDAINEDIAAIQKELNCIDIKVRPTEICDEALSNTLVGNVGNDTLQGGASNDDFFALDEFMFEDALFELKGLIEDFDSIEPTDMNLEQAEREIQSLAGALKQLQFDDQITSTDLARAQEMVDLWFEIAATQGDTGYEFPYEEWDKSKEHLKSLLGQLSDGYEFPMRPRLDDAAWDDLFAKLDERMAYFGAMETDIEFSSAEQDISGMVAILTQLSELEIVSEGDLAKAASLVDYFKLIVEANKTSCSGFEFPEENLARVEAHYNSILAMFQEQTKVQIDPALDEMMWDDAFSELDQMLAEFGTMSTDIDLETMEADIKRLSEQLKDVSFRETITDEDIQRAKWLVDYWKQLVDSPNDLEGFALPAEELESAEKHLEKLLMLIQDISDIPPSELQLLSGFDDSNIIKQLGDELFVNIVPGVDEQKWAEAYANLERLEEDVATIEMPCITISDEDLEKQKVMIAFYKKLAELPGSFSQKRTYLKYAEDEKKKLQEMLQLQKDRAEAEAQNKEAYKATTTEVEYLSKILETLQNQAANIAPASVELFPNEDVLAEKALLIASIEDVQREVSMLESIYTSTTATWIDDTQKRISVVEQLIDAVERLNEVSASVPAFNDPDGIPGRYAGGPVSAGSPYIVGEKGPELFVPSNNGNIVPNNELSASDSTEITLNFNGNKVGPMFSTKQIAKDVLREFEIMQGALS